MTRTGPVQRQNAGQRSDMRGGRLSAWLISVVACVLVLAPAAALAGTVTRPAPAHRVKVKGLTAKEQAAITIVSVTATGGNSLGVFVTATFKGDFERAVGRGHLKHALAALVLRFKPAAKEPPAGLVTRGAGIIGETLASTPSSDFGVVRKGRQLMFFIGGAGSANLASIEVRTFAAQPRSARRARSASTDLIGVVNQRAADAEKLVATNLANATCADLTALQARAAATLALTDMDERELTKLRGAITKELGRLNGGAVTGGAVGKLLNSIDDLLGGAATGVNNLVRELRLALQETDRNLARTRTTRDSLNVFLGMLKALIALNPGPCHPPATTPPPPPPPANATLSMSMAWSVFDPTEVMGTGNSTVMGGARRRSAQAADATSPLTAVKVVIPPSGSTPRKITNTLCPTQLPTATVSTTTNSNDTLTCAGGSLPVGQQFTLNVQTSPAPTTGMGGQLFGQQDGTFKGPFTITGP